MEPVPHPGDVEQHIMRDLGFAVRPVGDEMHGLGSVVPEMWTPGTTAVRTSILVAWADVVAGYLAMDLFTAKVPVTLDLDLHLFRPATAVARVHMVGRVAKSGRTVSMLSIDLLGDDGPLGFASATFMAAPNPSLQMPTIVRDDEGLLEPHPARLSVPFADRAGCERVGDGRASIPMRADGLNASGTLNGGLLALVVEEAALSVADPPGLASMTMHYAQPVRTGPAVAEAAVVDGLGRVEVRDEGREGRLAVIATTRAF